MIKKLGLSFIHILILFTLVSCGLTTTRPKLEMSLAQASFLAAKEVKAEIYAPAPFRKAELFYIKARSAYRRKYFNKAKTYAEECKKFSEEAEFEAVKKLLLNNY